VGHAEGQPEGWKGAAEATEARRAAEATVCLVEGMIVVCRGDEDEKRRTKGRAGRAGRLIWKDDF